MSGCWRSPSRPRGHRYTTFTIAALIASAGDSLGVVLNDDLLLRKVCLKVNDAIELLESLRMQFAQPTPCPGTRPFSCDVDVDGAARFRHHSNMRANVVTSACSDLCDVPCFKEGLVERLRNDLPSDDDLEAARVLFAALSDKSRLKILHALRTGEELCVCDVAHVLGMSVSSVSHHLRKLRDVKILKYRNDGKMAYYSLRNPVVATLLDGALRAA